MKMLTASALVLTLFATPASAGESLCDWHDQERVLAALTDQSAGDFAGDISVQIEAETVSTTKAFEDNRATLTAEGVLSDAFLGDLVRDPIALTLGAPIYDVDAVDDLLWTAETEWIADAVSMTPCGPEALPQLSGAFVGGEGLEGRVTLIPYFTDKIVMIFEIDYSGEWGLSEITGTALMEPAPKD